MFSYLIHFVLKVLKYIVTLRQRLLKLVIFVLIHSNLQHTVSDDV